MGRLGNKPLYRSRKGVVGVTAGVDPGVAGGQTNLPRLPG